MMAKQFLNLAGLVAFGLLLASCSGKEDAVAQGTVLTHNDFENVQGWNGVDEATISSERAHSGRYAVRVGPANEFGCTYIRSLGKMSVAKIRAVTVSAWVWVPSAQATSSLVVEIAHSPEVNKPVFYGSIPLISAAKKFREWQQVSQTFTLPDSAQATNQFKCYLWRAGSTENVFTDDITISVGN